MYKVGDKVRIKSIDWYNKNKDEDGDVELSTHIFVPEMSEYCGTIVTIKDVFEDIDDNVVYYMEDVDWDWTDEMIEGLVEKKISIKLTGEAIKNNEMVVSVDEYILPEGYIFKDENGNVINATKIVLEKKHDDKLKLESTKKVREYWNEYARIFIEIYDDKPDECVFTHLWVVDGQRQKGHGKRTLIEAEIIAKELGCHTAFLKVETDSWMHHWYLRCGYKWHSNAPDNYTWLTKHL